MKRRLFFILLFLFAEQTGIPNAFSQGGSFFSQTDERLNYQVSYQTDCQKKGKDDSQND